jgi:acyl-coenzyme A synthetase/AMP-(fatty) acid ligase
MHAALALPELAGAVVRALDDTPTRAALARTCRTLSAPALDALWAAPPVWHLARRMPEEMWAEECVGTYHILVSTPGPLARHAQHAC